MVGGRGLRGECPRRVPGRVPRDRARGDGLRPVLLPVARGALVLARRRSHCPDRRGAGVRVRTRVPRSDVARGCESGVPHRARMFRSRCGPSRPVPDRAASVEKADEARNAPGFRRDRLRGDPSQVCASNGARRVLPRTPHADLRPYLSRQSRKWTGIRPGPLCSPRILEGSDDRIRIPRQVPRRLGGRRGPGRSLGPLRVAAHDRGRGAAATCRPPHGVHGHLFDVSAYRCGAPRSEGLAVHLVVAPRSGARNRSDPRAILRQWSGSPPRVVQSIPRSSARGTHHGSRACPPGFPHPRNHRTLRRRRRDRGSWTPDTTRSRRERPALVRGPGCRGSGPRQVAVPDRVRGAPGPTRHRRRVLEGQGDGGALHGRGTHRGGRKMKRVSTHIEGLDEVLGGGIPEGNVVLVSGAPGTMKTSLTYHILHSSALNGSRGLYVSLEQGRASLIDHTEGLGYQLDDTHGNLSVLDLGMLRKKLTDRRNNRGWICSSSTRKESASRSTTDFLSWTRSTRSRSSRSSASRDGRCFPWSVGFGTSSARRFCLESCRRTGRAERIHVAPPTPSTRKTISWTGSCTSGSRGRASSGCSDSCGSSRCEERGTIPATTRSSSTTASVSRADSRD